ncbi:MAG TPA: ABC transporter substrate-binding protein [Gemmataceae bacterium]|nr:ABC transporter substrate-binding protein [Gemmataceae bacterium]
MTCVRSVGLGLVACTLAAVAAAGCTGKTPPEPILLGHVAPLTGPDKAAGVHAKQGILLAVEEANQDDNLVLGRKVNVVHADAPTPEAAQAEATRLLTVNKAVALLGGAGAAQAERLARAAQSGGAPLVTQTGLPAALVNEHVFSSDVAPARLGQVLARYAKEELKAGRAAVLADARSPACAALADGFATEFGRDAAPVLEHRAAADLAGAAGRAAKGKPAAVLVAGPAGDFGKARAELAKALPNVPLLFGGDTADTAALLANPDAAAGVAVATPYAAEAPGAANEAFVKAYRERFKEAPDASAALAYDGARMLFEALRQAKGTAPATVREQLGKLDGFAGLTGPLAVGKGRHARRPVFVARAEAGGVKLLKAYEPDARQK